MRICKKHGEYHWYGAIQPSKTCDVCKLEKRLSAALDVILYVARTYAGDPVVASFVEKEEGLTMGK